MSAHGKGSCYAKHFSVCQSDSKNIIVIFEKSVKDVYSYQTLLRLKNSTVITPAREMTAVMPHNKMFVLSPVLTDEPGFFAPEAWLFLSPLSGFVGVAGCFSLSLTVIVTVLVTEAPSLSVTLIEKSVLFESPNASIFVLTDGILLIFCRR